MNNFWLSLKTDIFFGKGQISVLGKNLARAGAKKVLLAYGHGSIKRNGVYDDIINELNNAQIKFCELSGIDPNPRISTVRKGAQICREENVDFIIAAGAGSVIDCCKAIAAARYYNGDPWDFFLRKATIKKAIPICTVLTLAATGSEMNAGTVISNEETSEKLATGSMKLKPKFSILDQECTFSVPKNQTAAGIADITSHIFEQYFSYPSFSTVDRMSEAILKTIIHYGPIAVAEPENYKARANIMWAGTIGLNGLLGTGKDGDWATHLIEHELSAKYDITHGVGLAILTPHWMKHVLDETNEHIFAEYGRNVWNINEENNRQVAMKAIEKTSQFFKEIGIPSNLSELGIDASRFNEMAESALKYSKIGRFKQLTKEDIVKIYSESL